MSNEETVTESQSAAREQRGERTASLYDALRLVIGDDRWGSVEVIEFADYIRTGEHPPPFGQQPSPERNEPTSTEGDPR